MPNRTASDIAAELESRAKSYDIIGNCDDKEFPASVEYHLSAGGDAARHTARLMREAASLLRAGPARKMIDPLRALVAQWREHSKEERHGLVTSTYRRCADELDALLSAPVVSPPLDIRPAIFDPEHYPEDGPICPAEIRHEWYRKKDTERGVYECPHCKMHTANVPLYFREPCPSRDRRKLLDRRKASAPRGGGETRPLHNEQARGVDGGHSDNPQQEKKYGCAPGCTYSHHGFHVADCATGKPKRL